MSAAAAPLVVATRFRGPPHSANGGYFVGRVAALASSTVKVRLLAPPPLETPLRVSSATDGKLLVHDGEQLVAQAEHAPIELGVPPPVAYMQAVIASRDFTGFSQHVFPGCFVCGPERARGDGLRIFPGALAPNATPTSETAALRVVAAPWVPDESLAKGTQAATATQDRARADDHVPAEIIAAALDCPGYFAVAEPGVRMLLAEMTAHVDRRVRVGEHCVVLGWPLRRDGRRAWAGTALFGEDGSLCARAESLWIEPRAA